MVAAKTPDTKAGPKRVKLNIEGEDECMELEIGRKRMKRFTLPAELSRWWQAKIIKYASVNEYLAKTSQKGDLPSPSGHSFNHPHVRARLEKHMGTNMVKLTDKAYMTELEDRIREVAADNLNKRISARVLDEMERLKRLILVGKTPLKECPPELYLHPVFVFWRMVNREVAKASKKRADIYYRKLKAFRKVDQNIEEEVEEVAEEVVPEQLTPEQLLEKCSREINDQKQLDIDKGVRFTDEQFAQVKYETTDVRTLKTLTTVDELYNLADKIIGTKRF